MVGLKPLKESLLICRIMSANCYRNRMDKITKSYSPHEFRVCFRVEYQVHLKPIVHCHMNLVGTWLTIMLNMLIFVWVLAKFQFCWTLLLNVHVTEIWSDTGTSNNSCVKLMAECDQDSLLEEMWLTTCRSVHAEGFFPGAKQHWCQTLGTKIASTVLAWIC